LSVLSLLFSTGVMAQEIRFGVRAGLNVANWAGDATQSANTLFALASDYTDRAFRTGFHAGVYTSIPLSSQFTLEPGVQYSQKGTVLKGDFTTNGASLLNATVTNKASYIDVPLLAKLYVTEGFHLFAGPRCLSCCPIRSIPKFRYCSSRSRTAIWTSPATSAA
jgi:hypothetical protein